MTHMQLAIVHYHLNRGGVTRVIENQLRGLATLDEAFRPQRAVIFYGGRADGWNDTFISESPFPMSQIVVPQLDYDQVVDSQDSRSARGESADDRGALLAALNAAGFQPEHTLVHVHNHSLGKNVRLLDMLHQLGDQGWRLLLQVHDFAEDLRPTNYCHLLQHADSPQQLQSSLYPQAAHVHYAVLTRRDWLVLQEAGVDEARLHVLPNPVPASQVRADRQASREKLRAAHDIPADRPYVIYPVRAIRRKNLGELLLWAAVLDSATFAVTLAPLNPHELATYQMWVALATEWKLPILFDVGGAGGMSLEASYAAADATITTSVAEGFGLVFLEASLANRPLFGRDLPGVTVDFRRVGLACPGLAESLLIPTEWVDREQLAQTYVQLTRGLRKSYDLAPIADQAIGQEVSGVLAGDTLDFARLDLENQQRVVRRVATSEDAKLQLRELNEVMCKMERFLAGSDRKIWQNNLDGNRTVIETNYSLNVVGERYARLCDRILRSRTGKLTGDVGIGQAVLQQFVKPDRLYPIRL